MPIKIEFIRKKQKFAVINTETRHVFGWHTTQASAQKQMAAMKENGVNLEGEEKKKKYPYS